MFGMYRSILALMVVASHLGGIPYTGTYAVFGFYILSGYLMTLIMQVNYGYTKTGLVKYGINRFLRIYPIYWTSISFSAVLILALGEEYTSHYHETMYLPQNVIDVCKNIFLFFPSHDKPRLTPPAWALTVEIFYYILIGLGISKDRKVVLYWLGLSMFYHILALALKANWDHRYFSIPAASLPFATGALIYHYKQNLLKCLNQIIVTANPYMPFLIFLSILINCYVGYISGKSHTLFFYTNYLLCTIMVVILSERKALPLVSKKLDNWLGDFSYPTYLFHYQAGLLVVAIMDKTGFPHIRPDISIMLTSIPLILVFSWFITIAIERPIELIRNLIKKSVATSKFIGS